MKIVLIAATACCLSLSTAHAGGGLAQALANAGVVAQGYQAYQGPQPLLPPTYYGYQPNLYPQTQYYRFPSGQQLNCVTSGIITQCY